MDFFSLVTFNLTGRMHHYQAFYIGLSFGIRLFLSIVFSMFIFQKGLSQPHARPFKLSNIDQSTFSFEVDTLKESEFYRLTGNLIGEKPFYGKTVDNDSLNDYLSSRIVEKDSCYIFTNGKKEELKICDRNGTTDRSNTSYKLLGIQCGYLIVHNFGYEWWRYILIDLQSLEYHKLDDMPIFIGCEYVYSQGNYYLQGQFVLIDLVNEQRLEFDSYNWILDKCFRHENNFYFEFTSKIDLSEKFYAAIKFH